MYIICFIYFVSLASHSLFQEFKKKKKIVHVHVKCTCDTVISKLHVHKQNKMLQEGYNEMVG